MKYAIISDIHSNYEALKAVLKKTAEIGVDAYAFCGDIIGYGPDPERCVQEIKKLPNFIGILGNHDVALFKEEVANWFSDYAKTSLKYTKKNLSDDSINFIKNLALEYHGTNFAMVHGSFFDHFREYLLSAEQFVLNLDKWKGSLCFVGHSHVPFIMSYKVGHMPKIDVFLGKDVTIKMIPNIRYMINPGSIGQPRDANAMASFGILDVDEHTFRLIRVEYDINSVQRKMAACGLPQILYKRLKSGK